MIALLYSLLYICPNTDKAVVRKFSDAHREYFGDDYCDEIFGESVSDERLVNGIDTHSISANQRLLILTYSLLYARSCDQKGMSKKTDKLCEHLYLDKTVLELFDKSFPPTVIQSLLGDNVDIGSFLYPSDILTDSINRFIQRVAQNSSIIKKRKLLGLISKEYEHDYDRMALEKLSHMPALEKVVKKFWEWGLEKFIRIQYTGSNIKVNAKYYPELHSMLMEACAVLDIKKVPDLYVEMGFLNAWTTGVNDPIIVISSGCVSLLTYDELMFIIGHELGHIKSQHVLYQELARAMPYIASVIGNLTLGIGQLLGSGLELALLDWMRKAEFSSDRAGLLVCQNVDAAVSTMMKLAGLPPRYYSTLDTDSFLKQADEFEGYDLNEMDKIVKFLSVVGNTHPWTVMRAKELNKWIKQGKYDAIIKEHNARSHWITSGKFCTSCGAEISKPQKFCTECGADCAKS